MIKKLSVIVPVYKVEKYIRPCIESIFNQGLSDDDYELIVVNDGTPDRSMEQITDLLEQHSNAIVINQENQGVAVARNSGLAKATGEYVLFFDSDDIMIEGSLKLMLDKALESQVDMVVGEHVEMNDEEIDAMSHPIVQPLISWKEHTSRQFFLYTDYKNGAGMPVIWRILYRREFLVDNKIEFLPKSYGEDDHFTFNTYLGADRILKTNILINIYRQRNGGSITSSVVSMSIAKAYVLGITSIWNLCAKYQLSGRDREKFIIMFVTEIITMFLKRIFPYNRRFSELMILADIMKQVAPDAEFGKGTFQRAITILYRISPRLLVVLWSVKWKMNRLLGKG